MTLPAEPTTRVVVMTGATNGIGAVAVAQLAQRPGTTVLIGARGGDRRVPPGVEALPLDLASLDGVRAFAAAVLERLDGAPIDALVLNAGTQSRDVRSRTDDGFETTFAVNHLSHQLLASLLVPHLAHGARLVMTTSDTHDPSVTPIAPRSLDPQELAHPTRSRFGAGMRAYAASKLCNLLTARSLAASTDLAARGVRVLAYNPGFTGGTNLGNPSRGAERFMSTVVFPVFSVIGRFKPAYAVGRPERAGEVLAQLSTGAIDPPHGQVYVSLVKGEVTYPAPSALAQDDVTRDDLWSQSAVMVGLADQSRPGAGSA